MGESAATPRLVPLFLALAMTCWLGFLFKAHCGEAEWARYAQYTTGCYSDAVPFWQLRGVAAGQVPYFQAPIEYPVLTGALIWLDGALTRAVFGPDASAFHFLDLVTLTNAALAFVVLWMLARAGVARARLWGWAVAPPLILYLGHNWDLLAVAFAVAALVAAREGRLLRASASAALGVAAKLFPIVALPLIGVQALERPGTTAERLRRASLVTLAAIVAWGAVNLVPALWAPANWALFYSFSQARGGTAAATWDVLQHAGLLATTIPERNLLATLSFAIGYAAILGLAWRRHRERLWVLATPALAWFLLTNKVYSPQYDLWLWPLLLMTAPRLWPVALFALTDIGAYFAEFWSFAGLAHVEPSATLATVGWWALARALVLLLILGDALTREPPAWISRTPPEAQGV